MIFSFYRLYINQDYHKLVKLILEYIAF